MISESMKEFFSQFRTKRDAAPVIIGYMYSAVDHAFKYLKQGRLREAKRTLADCLDAHAWYKALPYSLPDSVSVSTSTHAGGLPAGDKD